MKYLYNRIRWKYLLGIFKIKKIARRLLGVRRLDYDKKDIFMYTDTLREYETRARSVVKEPETVSWIDCHSKEGDVFYDVGANVGAYSLIAATRGMSVVAFEPAPQNVHKLHENTRLNNLCNQVVVVPLVLSEKHGTIKTHADDQSFGITHSFSFYEKPHDVSSDQTFLSIELDLCIKQFSLPEPSMLKIDVDGAEGEVLNGAPLLLKNPKLKHILIEIDNKNTYLFDKIVGLGFKFVKKEKTGPANSNYFFERVTH